MNKQKSARCSFCNKEEKEVNLLISGIKGSICNDCINQATSLINQKKEKPSPTTKRVKLSSPYKIKKYLDDYVIAQNFAKTVLSVAVYNHYKRLAYMENKQDKEVEIDKSNILLIGETGTGKTFLAQTISRLLQVPFCIVDATAFTQAGYVGEDIESILTRLLQASDYDTEKAERGIVFIDEIDKIGKKGDNPSITRDVSGEGVQQSLLKLLEGAKVLVPPQGGRKHPEQKMVQINTTNILFICGGAFVGLEKIIQKRLDKQRIGFTLYEKKNNPSILHSFESITSQDLKYFGLIPELIGRLPVICHLEPLDKKAIKQILLKPKNAILKQYVQLFKMDRIDLKINNQAINFIVEKALEHQLGARGLRSICERIFNPLFFEVRPRTKVKTLKLTREMAEHLFSQSKESQTKKIKKLLT